jgi:hypothetical protein
LPSDHRASPSRCWLFACVSGTAVAASMAMLWAMVAFHGAGLMLVMPLFTALAVSFALGLHGVRGDGPAAVLSAALTALASAAAVALTVGLHMAIQFRMDLHHVLRAMGVEMTWAIWRARQTLLADALILAGILLAAWLAYRPLGTGRRE